MTNECTKTEEVKIAELEAFRGVGGTFIYLGKMCQVVRYFDTDFNYSNDTANKHAKLHCRYLSNHGVIQDIEFDYAELEVLKAENE